MWQVLKALTILFSICPGLYNGKRILIFIFSRRKHFFPNFFSLGFLQGEKQNSIFFSLGFSQGEFFLF